MAYVALARKYRPAHFAEIVGQEHVVRTLQNSIRLDRVHHAFLFTGARGVGKTTTARVLACALNSEGGPTPEPRLDSPVCQEIMRGDNPDVIEIDGASNTGVDNIRELREATRYMPQRGGYKIYIIDEVHMLSHAAFNALLKTLEEPPAHVKFIFATTEPQKIPATILSRCQRFDFRKVGVMALTQHFRSILDKEEISLGPAAIDAVVREAQGSVRDGLSLLDQFLSYVGGEANDAQVIEALGLVDRQTIFDWMDTIIERDPKELLHQIAEIDRRGRDLADAAGLLVEHLRDLMVVKVVKEPEHLVLDRSEGELEALNSQAQRCQRSQLQRYFSLAVEVTEDVGRSMHPRITLEMGLLRLLEVESAPDLTNLLQRLDDLTRGHHGTQGSSARPQGSQKDLGSKPSLPSLKTTLAVAPTEEQNKREVLVPEGSSVAKAALTEPGEDTAAGVRGSKQSSEGVVEWSKVVELIKERRPALGSVLEHGHVISFGPKRVELGFKDGTFYWDSVRKVEHRQLLEDTLREMLEAKTQLVLNVLDEGDERLGLTLASSMDLERQNRLEALEEGARNHPTVKNACAILEAKVLEIETHGDAGSASDPTN
jgi:DNA polymerase III subunit gamma/tau